MCIRWRIPSASATPWDSADESSLTPTQRFVMLSQRDAYGRNHTPGPHDAPFFDGCMRDRCPLCQSGAVSKSGFDARGVQRYGCLSCRRRFSPLTGTVFESHRISVEGWFEFLLGIMSYESLAGIAQRDRRSPTAPPYQLAKVFIVPPTMWSLVLADGSVGNVGVSPGLAPR